MVKKSDVIILLSVVLVATVIIALFFLFSPKGSVVRITSDGGAQEFPLNEDKTVVVEQGENQSNTVVIKDGNVFVESADCPDKICVNHIPISRDGEIIVCLPHKMTVEIK